MDRSRKTTHTHTQRKGSHLENDRAWREADDKDGKKLQVEPRGKLSINVREMPRVEVNNEM